MKLLFLDDDAHRHWLVQKILGSTWDVIHVNGALPFETALRVEDDIDVVMMDYELGEYVGTLEASLSKSKGLLSGKDAAKALVQLFIGKPKKPRIIIHARRSWGVELMERIFKATGYIVKVHQFDLYSSYSSSKELLSQT